MKKKVLLLTIFFLVSVTTSLAAEDITIPNITGMDYDKAINILRSSKLDVKIIPQITSIEKFNNKVYIQNPQAGQKVPAGYRVDLYTYSYKPAVEMVTVPNVIGLHESQCYPKLQGLGLGVQTSPDLHADTDIKEKDRTVASQQPGSGTRVPKGTAVKIIFFQFVDIWTTMPNVVGMPIDEAGKSLSQAGFLKWNQIRNVPTKDQNLDNKVAKQSIPAGQKITKKAVPLLYTYLYKSLNKP